MRVMISMLMFVCMLVSIILSDPVVGMSAAQCTTEVIRSPTHGKPASKFVSGCEIFLFGKYLEPIEGPGGELGYLIEKMGSAVTLNGIHYYSPYDPQRKRVRPPSEKAERFSAIADEVTTEVRSLAVPHPSIEKAYYIDSVLYMNKLKPYVTASGDTVMLKFSLDSVEMIYEDIPLVFPLTLEQGPSLSEEEWNELYLDRAYHGLASIRPGFIILVGRGYKDWHQISEAPALKAAIAKIPSLAKRRYQNIYGEWVYESLTIDGFIFSLTVVADFAEK